MSLLRLLGLEGDEGGGSTFSSSIPETVSLHSEDSPSDSELSDFDDGPARHSSVTRAKQQQGFAQRGVVGTRNSPRQHQIQPLCYQFDPLDSCDSLCFGMGEENTSGITCLRKDGVSAFDGTNSPDFVTIAVEVSQNPLNCGGPVAANNDRLTARQATALTGGDVDSHGMNGCDDTAFPTTLENIVVGVVQRCGPEARDLGLRPGFRVASMLKCGAASKFVTVPVLNLCLVPKQLDAGDVAALISSYLPGFQALHHGRPKSIRYRRDCMKGMKVLVTGGATLDGQAVMRLARWSGAQVFVTAPQHHFPILEKLSAVTVMDDDPRVWLPELHKKMDIVVDYEFPRDFYSIRKVLAPKGRLICLNPRQRLHSIGSWMAGLEEFFERYQLSMIKRASLFDFAESFALHPEEVRCDLTFLLKLLATRQLRPRIDRYIKLRDVPRVRSEIQGRPHAGAVICEPWNE